MTEVTWHLCAIQYYQDGVKHIHDLENFYNAWLTEDLDSIFNRLMNRYMTKNVSLVNAAGETVYRTYRTPCFVYEGRRIPRTSDWEDEFLLAERLREDGFNQEKIKEIWRFSFRDEKVTHSNEFFIASETVLPTRGLYISQHYGDLESLIRDNMTLKGWTKAEVIYAIKKVISTDFSKVQYDWEREQMEWLRSAARKNPEILASPEIKAA